MSPDRGAKPLVVTEQQAEAFIDGYGLVLVAVFGSTPDDAEMDLLEVLVRGREKYLADRALLDEALRNLEAHSILVPPEVEAAIRSLEVKRWFYLKDTGTYSVFIDPDEEVAYAVLGLTDRIRDILGGTGALVEIGLVKYHGRYVCDGLVTSVVWLGSNYRKDLTRMLADIRARGAFRNVP